MTNLTGKTKGKRIRSHFPGTTKKRPKAPAGPSANSSTSARAKGKDPKTKPLPPWFDPWIKALADCGNKTLAAAKVGIERSTPRKYFDKNPNPEAEKMIDDATLDGHEAIVALYYRRALRGSEKAQWNIIQATVGRFKKKIELEGSLTVQDLSKMTNEELLEYERKIKR